MSFTAGSPLATFFRAIHTAIPLLYKAVAALLGLAIRGENFYYVIVTLIAIVVATLCIRWIGKTLRWAVQTIVNIGFVAVAIRGILDLCKYDFVKDVVGSAFTLLDTLLTWWTEQQLESHESDGTGVAKTSPGGGASPSVIVLE